MSQGKCDILLVYDLRNCAHKYPPTTLQVTTPTTPKGSLDDSVLQMQQCCVTLIPTQ